jgi:hypothetical protein
MPVLEYLHPEKELILHKQNLRSSITAITRITEERQQFVCVQDIISACINYVAERIVGIDNPMCICKRLRSKEGDQIKVTQICSVENGRDSIKFANEVAPEMRHQNRIAIVNDKYRLPIRVTFSLRSESGTQNINTLPNLSQTVQLVFPGLTCRDKISQNRAQNA